MTVKDALDQGRIVLAAAGISSDRLDAELLLAHVLKKDRSWLIAHDDNELPKIQLDQYDRLIARRKDHEPLVHLTGRREFYSLDFEITPDVLTPRVETEQMVEWAIKYAPTDSKLIDIGTGCGAIAVAIAKNRPDLEVWATDVTKEAVQVAARNAKHHGVSINFIQSELWEAISGKFETAVTNLPYLKNDADLMPEVSHEPAVALFGGADGLEIYQRFLKDLPSYLKSDGYLFTECDPWQQDELITEVGAAGLDPIERGYFIMGFKRR